MRLRVSRLDYRYGEAAEVCYGDPKWRAVDGAPQEKKRLSLARDNLSTTGEAPHALRNHWKKKKRSAERARRTAERIALEVRPEDFAPVRRRTVRKWGWERLGHAIAAKLEARADQTPRKSAAARERRRLRRGSKRRNAKAT